MAGELAAGPCTGKVLHNPFIRVGTENVAAVPDFGLGGVDPTNAPAQGGRPETQQYTQGGVDPPNAAVRLQGGVDPPNAVQLK